jgi:ubiquinone/menaquinone biosynthesis C-methylase UbiE
VEEGEFAQTVAGLRSHVHRGGRFLHLNAIIAHPAPIGESGHPSNRSMDIRPSRHGRAAVTLGRMSMPAALDPIRSRARSAYDAASDRYDDMALGFWTRSGERTIDRLGLRPGMHVLDVASGSGASVLPAARRVGPTGRVIGVDLSEPMLALGRQKADRAGFEHVEFQLGDMTRTGYPDGSFDAVVCVFGLSLAPDMAALAAELWRMVRPGGKLAITTWGPRLWSPMYEVWQDAVRRERPDLAADFHPWSRITTPTTLADLLRGAGIARETLRILPEFDVWPLRSAHDWWSIVMGSGLRWTIDQLQPDAIDRVRRANLDHARQQDVASITCNVLYATATKPLTSFGGPI